MLGLEAGSPNHPPSAQCSPSQHNPASDSLPSSLAAMKNDPSEQSSELLSSYCQQQQRNKVAVQDKEGILSNHAKGTLICIVGMLILCPDSLLIRKLADVDIFTIILYRGLVYVGSLLLILIVQEREKSLQSFLSIGRWGALAGLIWGASQFFITYALYTASVGSVLVINSANPMFSAIFSHFLLGEVTKLRTIVAGLVCFAAIVVIFFSEMGEGAGSVGGIICALGASSTMGLYFTLLRWVEVKNGRAPNSNACNVVAGVFTVLVSAIIVNGQPDSATSMEWLYIFLDGAVVMTLSYIALSIGPSMISAPEVSLCTLLETALAPLLVFVAGYERPSYYAIGGGAALVVALACHSAVAIHEESRDALLSKATSLSQLEGADADSEDGPDSEACTEMVHLGDKNTHN